MGYTEYGRPYYNRTQILDSGTSHANRIDAKNLFKERKILKVFMVILGTSRTPRKRSPRLPCVPPGLLLRVRILLIVISFYTVAGKPTQRGRKAQGLPESWTDLDVV